MKKSKKIKNKVNNTHMHVVMYLFLILFLSMMGYFMYYVQFDSKVDVNNTYNTRQENLEKKVIRGSILADDRQVLARTVLMKSGEEVRDYPFGETFCHVVGFSTRGRYGIENLANISLLTSNADISERITNDISDIKNMGDSVVTTLNVRLQEECKDTLGIYKGAIVVSEAKTGKILAMYSNPGFDPNYIVRDWDELEANVSESPLYNRAAQGLYPPGSTFKIVTLLEYLKENENPDSYHFSCNGRFTYEGVTVNCYHGSNHGAEDLKKSFAKSCNSSFANIGTNLDPDKYSTTAEDLLFNNELPIKIPYSKGRFTYNKDSDVEEKLHTAIGQGKTLVTPLQMNMITAAIANNGVLQEYYLIDRIENNSGAVIKQFKPNIYKKLMTEQEANSLKEYMALVVQEGTGTKLKDLPYTVAGKTGSAEYNDEKGESHAWFTGFSNVDDPDIAVTVIVEGAGSGGDYAVPMAKRIFDAYYLH